MKNSQFWLDKKILITGASGFIGNAFAKKLQAMSKNVVLFSRDGDGNGFDLNSLNKQMKNVDIVINCAGVDGNGQFKKSNSAFILGSNVNIIANVLESARLNNVGKIILFSSSEIYSKKAKVPFKEEDDYLKYPDLNTDGYVLSKIFTEILGKKYENNFDMDVLILRPTNIYGNGDKKDRVIPTIIGKIKNNETIEIWGDGKQKRNFLHIDDLVDNIIQLIEVNATGTYNLGSDDIYSILELLNIISLETKTKPRINYIKSIEQNDRYLNLNKIKKVIKIKNSNFRKNIRKLI